MIRLKCTNSKQFKLQEYASASYPTTHTRLTPSQLRLKGNAKYDHESGKNWPVVSAL